jgi:hypothetical protein
LSTRSFVVLVYRSAIDLSSSALRLLTRHLAERRSQLKTRWRRLSPGRQALLALAHLRCGDTYQRLAVAFEVGVATAYRYVREAVDVLASLAPTLDQAVRTATSKAFVILDGTLLPIDRVAADRPYYSGKHKKHGMNVQVITDPFGRLLWASPALPGAVHDIKAARTTAGVRCWADKGYQGARAPSASPTAAAGPNSPQARRPSTSPTPKSRGPRCLSVLPYGVCRMPSWSGSR